MVTFENRKDKEDALAVLKTKPDAFNLLMVDEDKNRQTIEGKEDDSDLDDEIG